MWSCSRRDRQVVPGQIAREQGRVHVSQRHMVMVSRQYAAGTKGVPVAWPVFSCQDALHECPKSSSESGYLRVNLGPAPLDLAKHFAPSLSLDLSVSTHQMTLGYE